MAKTILKTPPASKDADSSSPTRFEPLLTIRAAAELTGLRYWLLLRAVNHGDVPSYQFGNKRRRVRLADIEAAIAIREGHTAASRATSGEGADHV